MKSYKFHHTQHLMKKIKFKVSKLRRIHLELSLLIFFFFESDLQVNSTNDQFLNKNTRTNVQSIKLIACEMSLLLPKLPKFQYFLKMFNQTKKVYSLTLMTDLLFPSSTLSSFIIFLTIQANYVSDT